MINIVLSIQDADRDRFPISVYGSVNNATTVSEMVDQAHALWDVIRPLITGVLVGVETTIVSNDLIGGWTNNTPDALSDVQEKARLSWRVPFTGGSRFRLTLPTIREGMFVLSGAGKILDLTNTDVATFVAFMQPNALPDFHAVDSHEYDLGNIDKYYQWFQ